jgi:predicted MFS family arabinose efflux permease
MNGITSRFRTCVLVALTAAYALNSLDRSVLYLLLEPIRHEFLLTDAQLGLLSGTVFALFYSGLAIPIAVLADRGSRRRVLAISVLLWSVMTALCGLAGSFALLLFTRIGVAVGEAGSTPASHSLLADLYPPDRRASVLGTFAIGAPLGSALAGFIGGTVAEQVGWRGALLFAAAPGLLLAPLLWLTLPDPPSRATEATRRHPGTLTGMRRLLGHASFRHLCAGCALHAAAMYAAASFNPAFLARTHQWNATRIGTLFTVAGLCGFVGTLGGGWLADRLGRSHRDPRWLGWVPAMAIALALPFQLIAYFAGHSALVFGALLMSSLLATVFFGPSHAMTQLIAQPGHRATASSVLLFVKALVGLGVGPLLVGNLSDALRPAYGEDSLRVALLAAPLLNLWAVAHFVLAGQALRANASSGHGEQH